jgi:hypothetical protein
MQKRSAAVMLVVMFRLRTEKFVRNKVDTFTLPKKIRSSQAFLMLFQWRELALDIPLGRTQRQHAKLAPLAMRKSSRLIICR